MLFARLIPRPNHLSLQTALLGRIHLIWHGFFAYRLAPQLPCGSVNTLHLKFGLELSKLKSNPDLQLVLTCNNQFEHFGEHMFFAERQRHAQSCPCSIFKFCEKQQLDIIL